MAKKWTKIATIRQTEDKKTGDKKTRMYFTSSVKGVVVEDRDGNRQTISLNQYGETVLLDARKSLDNSLEKGYIDEARHAQEMERVEEKGIRYDVNIVSEN